MSTITTVARREIRDSLSDWRMMLPVSILTFVVPMLIQIAVLFMFGFLKEADTVAQMVPFALLLCGFVPASFSLISALESFVGEKERNTLESLLAMPMSDSELYLGKLGAALSLPLLSSLCAMATFTLLMIARAPAELLALFTPLLMVEMVALVVSKAVVMVAGAVIISSHTTTTRAANLLASFVLIPMAMVIQIEALLIISKRIDLLAYILIALMIVALMLVRTGMAAFNREAILGREHAPFSFGRIGWTFGRFWSSYQPAGVVPERYTGRFGLRHFYRRDLPALLRDYRMPLFVATAGGLGGLVLGSQLFGMFHTPMLDRFLGAATQSHASFGGATRIFARNAQVSFWSNVFAPFSFGLFSFLVPTLTFTQIGYGAAWSGAQGGSAWLFVGHMLPYGLFQIPAMIVSAALGLRIGVAVLQTPQGFSIGQNMLWALANFVKVWLFMIVPLLLVAGLIEGLLVPLLFR